MWTRVEPLAETLLAGETRSPVAWAEAYRRLAEAEWYWLATVRPDGRPHVVPILAVGTEGALCFVAGSGTRKALNLAANPGCVLAAESGPYHLVCEGRAGQVRDEAGLRRVAAAFAGRGWPVEIRDGALHGEGAPTAGPPPYDVYEVVPTLAFAFGADESVAPTRWRFAAASATAPLSATETDGEA